MESRAKILGHAIHPILIVFPLGLLATAVVFDVIYLIWGNPDMANVAYWMMAAGIVGGLLAAPFGHGPNASLLEFEDHAAIQEAPKVKF